jgi:hypothetical protein
LKSNFHQQDIINLIKREGLVNLNQTENYSNEPYKFEDLKIESNSIQFPSNKDSSQQSTSGESLNCKYYGKEENFYFGYDDAEDYGLRHSLFN